MESKKNIDLIMCGVCIKLSQMECEVDYIKLLIENTFLKEILTLVVDDEGDETMELLVTSTQMLKLFSSIEISKMKAFLYLLYPVSDDLCFVKTLEKMIEFMNLKASTPLSFM